MHASGYYESSPVLKALGLPDLARDADEPVEEASALTPIRQGQSTCRDVLDLGRIPDLRAIRLEGDGSAVTVGAMVRHAEIGASRDIAARIPALADLAGMIADGRARSRGTLGGALAYHDPAADYPVAALALGATVNTNRRRIAADAYFGGDPDATLGPGELIASVTFPVPERAAYLEFRNASSREAPLGVFVAKMPGGARVAVGGVSPQGPFRVRTLEQALAQEWAAAALRGVDVPCDELRGDMRGSADRAHLISVLAQRAVRASVA